MEQIDKRLYYAELLHLYGELLSVAQLEILRDHLECDLSISEIAENRGTTRSAVEDAIKKGIAKLEDFEDKLEIYSIRVKINNATKILKEKVGNCKELKDLEEAFK